MQAIYEDGLVVPDDVSLLFADDNFGSIRRLPTTEENQRKGGVGVSACFTTRHIFYINARCLVLLSL